MIAQIVNLINVDSKCMKIVVHRGQTIVGIFFISSIMILGVKVASVAKAPNQRDFCE